MGMNGVRVAPVIALAHGYSLYPGEAEGPIHGWIYGPVAALWYAPALLGSLPSVAVKLAFAANLAAILIAVGVGLRGIGKMFSGVWFLALGVMLLILVWMPATSYWTTILNADISAVMFATAGIVMAGHPRMGWPRIACVGALFSLAIFTKQNAVFVPPAVFFAWWTMGRLNDGLRLGLATCLAVVLLAAGCALIWGAGGVWFNLIEIPASHPLSVEGEWKAIQFLAIWILPLCAVYFLAACVFEFRKDDEVLARSATARLFLFVGLLSLPIGFAGTSKIGGDLNSFHSAFYLLVACMLKLPWQRWWNSRALALSLVSVGLAGFVAVRSQVTLLEWWNLRTYTDDINFAMMKANPGAFYFPWQPQLSLMCNGVLYDSEYGVFDRWLAGKMPSEADLKANTPRDVKFVIYPDYTETQMLLKAYPDAKLIDHTPGFRRYAVGRSASVSPDLEDGTALAAP